MRDEVNKSIALMRAFCKKWSNPRTATHEQIICRDHKITDEILFSFNPSMMPSTQFMLKYRNEIYYENSKPSLYDVIWIAYNNNHFHPIMVEKYIFDKS